MLFFAFSVSLLFLPMSASAFSFSAFLKNLFYNPTISVGTSEIASALISLDQDSLLNPAINTDPQAGRGGAEIQFVGDNAILPVVGPLGNVADADEARSYRITTYTVREGDNLSVIAKTFGISIGTIFWANDIKRADLIKPGDVLIILPVSGLKYTVKTGDTVASIAKKYGGDVGEIVQFNDLLISSALIPGQEIIVPNIDLAMPARTYVAKSRGGGPNLAGYFLRPINGGIKSQGLHGYNGVDLATYCGAPLYASASGDIITARNSGWNGGYGRYIVISHPNSTQTVYAHIGSLAVGTGWYVTQGQVIGTVGSTGNSTGCHVHFEIRGAANSF